MRIAFDARMMGPQNTRGIGRYAEELLRALLALKRGHRFVLLERNPSASPFKDHPDVEHIAADIQWYTLKEQLAMPGLIASAKADLLHVPHWNVSVFPMPGVRRSTQRVVTIHDLILLEEPTSANVTTRGPLVAGIKRISHRIALANALYRSRAILVPTEHVKERILFFYPDLKTPVIVTGEGMPEPDESLWRDPDFAHPYFLTVGSAYPHKNLELAVEAWRSVAERHPGVRLIVIGKKDQFMERLKTRVTPVPSEVSESRESLDSGALRAPNGQHPIHSTSLGTNPKSPAIEFRGEISDVELRELYARAMALIFPSRLEGFGLPPLEALAAGCPVISSNAPPMPEVLGEEGISFFNPTSADGIVRAVESVLRNPSDARGNARRIVPALQKQHSWQAAAARTLEVYETAAKR